MSMRCMTVPPRMKPSGLASFGSTTCTISVSDSAARFGVRSDISEFRFQTSDLLQIEAFRKSRINLKSAICNLKYHPLFAGQRRLLAELLGDALEHPVHGRMMAHDEPRHEAEDRIRDPAIFG